MTQNIKDICRQYDLRPAKSLGQNFLMDKNILKKIIFFANVGKNDVVVEVGPGTGVLTAELLKEAKLVYAVEKDKRAASILKASFKEKDNKLKRKLELIEGDILKEDLEKLGLKDGKYKVVANIPYNITSAIIRKFLSGNIKPKEMILLVQKEVAQRIVSRPPDMSVLSVSVLFYGKPKILAFVSKNCFWPRPKVDSAILKITAEPDRFPYEPQKEDLFFKLVKAGFSAKRKQLKNNLAKGLNLDVELAEYILLEAGLKKESRAQELSIDDWLELYKFLEANYADRENIL